MATALVFVERPELRPTGVFEVVLTVRLYNNSNIEVPDASTGVALSRADTASTWRATARSAVIARAAERGVTLAATEIIWLNVMDKG